MKSVSVMSFVLMLGLNAILFAADVRAAAAETKDLPSLKKEDLVNEERVEAFVNSFLKRDRQASELLNPSNQTLFSQGYRPVIGVLQDPEAKGQRFRDIKPYFIRKLFLDLNAIQPLNREGFEMFVDQIGYYSDQTVICAGTIAHKYGFKTQGRFVFEEELKKVPQGAEREEFKQCWLNDFVLGTELRMLAWIYLELFGVPYSSPEKRLKRK